MFGRRQSVRSSKYDEEGFERVDYKIPKTKDEDFIAKLREIDMVENELDKIRLVQCSLQIHNVVFCAERNMNANCKNLFQDTEK